MILEALTTPLDPLHGDGYQFWSGIGSGSPIFVVVYVLYRKHNCHSKGCWRIGRHQVTGTEYTVCRKHHPHDKPTEEQILREHEESKC